MVSDKLDYYERRIEDLEEKIQQLRISRRVLMNLIESMEKEKNIAITFLTSENKKLKSTNVKYAKRLLGMKRDSLYHKDSLNG